MTTLQIEHDISDFTAWKASFDRYGGLRKEQRVRSYEIHQPVDNPTHVMIRLEFDSVEDAQAMIARMRGLWASREATPALRGEVSVSILQRKAVETLA